jgi:hypothetical protein
MRESRLSGSVEGVTSNHDSYSDSQRQRTVVKPRKRTPHQNRSVRNHVGRIAQRTFAHRGTPIRSIDVDDLQETPKCAQARDSQLCNLSRLLQVSTGYDGRRVRNKARRSSDQLRFRSVDCTSVAKRRYPRGRTEGVQGPGRHGDGPRPNVEVSFRRQSGVKVPRSPVGVNKPSIRVLPITRRPECCSGKR